MGKLLSDKERKLQKKLIPLNIFVCILALVAAISLFFTPIIKFDFGKLLGNESLMQTFEDEIDKNIGGGDGEIEGMNYQSVISTVVVNVLGNAKGSIAISPYSSLKVLMNGGEGDNVKVVFEELVYPLMYDLVDSLVDGIVSIFSSPEGKAFVEEVVVSTLATTIVNEVNNENLTESVVKELAEKLRDIEKVGTDGVTIESVANNIIDVIAEVFGDEVSIGDDEREQIIEEVQNMYDETKAKLPEGQNVTIEAIVCILASQEIDFEEFNLEKIIESIFEGNNGPETAALHVAADDGETQEKPVYSTYTQLLEAMGLNEQNITKLKDTLKDLVGNEIGETLSEYDEMFGYYGYLCLVMLVFIVPWLILFLFSFFHMFAKNKRFVMWYVKLYSFIPGLIALALILAPTIMPMIPPLAEMLAGEEGVMVNAVLGSLSSFMWISGICYVLLWLVSIFWAFPIKHKIRKERKLCKKAMKNGTYSYGAPPAYGTPDNYGGGYGAGGYGSYGGSSYDGLGGLGDSYDSYGGDSYGSDYDSYGSSGYGSGYGSYDYDDDDDDLF